MATNKQARARAQETRKRAAEMRRQQQAKERRRRIIIAAIVAFVVAGAGVGIYFAATAGGGIKLDAVKTYKNLSQQHTKGKVSYKQNPPVGGMHNAQWLNC